jgi:hypothetical protein
MTQQEKNSNEDSIPDLQRYLQEWSKELDVLRQNHLLDEAQFISFARERDVPVTGLVTGDPGEFHKRGWLTSDGEDYKGELAFHPFRVYPLHQAVRANNPGSLTGSPTSDGFGTAAQVRNKVLEVISKRCIMCLHEQTLDRWAVGLDRSASAVPCQDRTQTR